MSDGKVSLGLLNSFAGVLAFGIQSLAIHHEPGGIRPFRHLSLAQYIYQVVGVASHVLDVGSAVFEPCFKGVEKAWLKVEPLYLFVEEFPLPAVLVVFEEACLLNEALAGPGIGPMVRISRSWSREAVSQPLPSNSSKSSKAATARMGFIS